VVLTGDLNVPHGTDEYDEMRRALGHDLVDLSARAGLVTYDVAGNDLAARFRSGGPEVALYDYILTSPGRVDATEVRTILVEPLADLAGRPPGYEGRAFASDHYGVGATLTIG
jgi:endonuclease/exonuclease/phosphatase family metal-dependent hydrolase